MKIPAKEVAVSDVLYADKKWRTVTEVKVPGDGTVNITTEFRTYNCHGMTVSELHHKFAMDKLVEIDD